MPSSFPIKYRRATWADYVGCKAVLELAFRFGEWANFTAAWPKRSAAACWVATYRDIIVGFSLIADNTIKYIAVNPAYQGYKIGSGLLKRSLESLPDLRTINLVTAGDERLVGWYGRFGFRVTYTFRDEDGDFRGAIMVRRQRCRSSVALR
jgi:ribosomal protein S18 acetylase RimI-like enzyme